MTKFTDRPVLNNYAYLGDNRAIAMTNYGQRLLLDTRNVQSSSIITHGEFEPAVAWAMTKYTKPGSTVIDVGANLGFFTLLACQLTGANGHVYAMEPNPDIFQLLKSSIKINAFSSRATLVNAAAFDRAASVELAWDEAKHGGGRIRLSEGKGKTQRQETVPAMRVDDVIDPDHLPVSLLKIDTEGSEPYVFAGAQATLDASPDCVVITEWNPAFMKTRQASAADLATGLKSRFRQVLRLVGPGKTKPLAFDSLTTQTHANLLLLP